MEQKIIKKFIIEDEFHGEICGEFDIYEEAISELKRRYKLPGDEEPNIPPYGSDTCGRDYILREMHLKGKEVIKIIETYILEVSLKGENKWLLEDN